MSSGAASLPQHRSTVDAAWTLLRAASALAEGLDRSGRIEVFGEDELHGVRPLAGSASASSGEPVLAWHPGVGWESRLSPNDDRSELLSLYLPICSATSRRPLTIGHLGQSLDGFIATPSGDSQTVTGSDNIVHMHRLRALCDAVLVGAGTVAADDPLLTTRHVTPPVDTGLSCLHGLHRSCALHLRTQPDRPG
jgi:diaminohydroxyphosphoribosylaminopyrimidine deaminase/5-amino-6-(5-phosphoribosylamino)uracil reductase